MFARDDFLLDFPTGDCQKKRKRKKELKIVGELKMETEMRSCTIFCKYVRCRNRSGIVVGEGEKRGRVARRLSDELRDDSAESTKHVGER